MKASDFDQVVSLLNEALPGTLPHHDPAASVQRKLRHEDDLLFVAEVDDRIVGSVMAGYDGHRGWIYSLAVLQQFQRQGIGSALVKHAETELEKRGCPKMNLQVNNDNESVVAFYRRLGYSVEQRISLGKLLTSTNNSEAS